MKRAVLLLGLVATACASGPFAPSEPTSREVELERRLLAVEKEATKARLELERMRQRLAELEARGASAALSPAPSQAEPRPALRPAAAAAAAAAAPPAPAPPLVPGARTQAIEESDLDEKVLAGSGAATDGSPPAASDDEAGAYERALAPLREGRAEEAEGELEGFVAAYPRSELTDNAWFWIGESRLMRQDVDGALTAFRTGVESFPDGNKTPDSLFKLGHCLALQGDRERSAEVWRELVRRFPSTAAAERAREALEGR